MITQQATNKKTAMVATMTGKGDGAGRAVSPKAYTEFDELPDDLLYSLSEEALAEYPPDDVRPAAGKASGKLPEAKDSNGHKPTAKSAWLRVDSAADLIAEGSESTIWLTQDFVAAGELVIVSGKPGSQKSLLMLYWASCVATGEPFLAGPNGLGGRLTHKARVLWVNTDNSRVDHKNRVIAVSKYRKSREIPIFSVTVTDFELKNAGHVKALLALADSLQADVIVIDTLSGCLAGVDENTAAAMSGPAANLRMMTDSGRTVIAIHHPPKNDSEGTRGSSVLPGKVDRALTVGRDKAVVTVKSTKSRGYEYGDIVALSSIAFDPDTKTITGANFFNGESAKDMAQTQAARETIRAALESGPMNVRNARKACAGIGAAVVGRAIDAMLADGVICEKAGARGARELSLTVSGTP